MICSSLSADLHLNKEGQKARGQEGKLFNSIQNLSMLIFIKTDSHPELVSGSHI